MTMTIQSLYLRSCYCIILHCIVRRCRTKFRVTPTTFPCRLPYTVYMYIMYICIIYHILYLEDIIYILLFYFNYYSIIPGLGVNQVKGSQTFLAYCMILAYSRTRVLALPTSFTQTPVDAMRKITFAAPAQNWPC